MVSGEAGLPAERCDKRTDQDEAAFEAYRSKVEAYEIPYLQQKNNAASLDRDIMRNDPVDRPVTQNSAAAVPIETRLYHDAAQALVRNLLRSDKPAIVLAIGSAPTPDHIEHFLKQIAGTEIQESGTVLGNHQAEIGRFGMGA